MGMLRGPQLRTSPGDVQTLGDALRRAARRSPARGVTFVESDGREVFVSYSELHARAEERARALRAAGVGTADVVALCLEGLEAQVVAFWATVLAGAVALPATDASGGPPPGCRWLVTSSPSDPARSVLPLDHLPRASTRLPSPAPDDLALLLETSGSTGRPKRVMHTHRTLLARSAASAQANRFDSADVSLNWLPLDHVGGLVMFHVRDVFVGCAQVQADRGLVIASPVRWLDWIERHHVTISWAPNSAYALVVARSSDVDARRRDLSSLRFLLNGGEAIVPRQARRFLELLEPHGLSPSCMHPAWGMSETASGIVYAHELSLERFDDSADTLSVGRPLPGFAVRVVDDSGALQPEATEGHLEVSGPSITPGYHENRAATEEAFTADGWLRTGDRARIANGRLTITGREKDVVIVGGLNHSTREIESVVEEIDGIVPAHTCALAVRRPIDRTEQLVVFACAASPTAEGLRAAVHARLRERRGIDAARVVFLAPEELPRTSIGKISRAALRERYLAGAFAEREMHPLPKGEGACGAEDRVRTIVGEVLGAAPGTLETGAPLAGQVGLDSLSRLEIVTALEKAFAVRLPSQDVGADVRIRDLTVLVENARASA